MNQNQAIQELSKLYVAWAMLPKGRQRFGQYAMNNLEVVTLRPNSAIFYETDDSKAFAMLVDQIMKNLPQ